MSKGAAVLTALAVIVFSCGSCIAEENARIRGTITDPSGAVIPKARIIIHEEEPCASDILIKGSVVLASAKDGTFQSQVQPGSYIVLVSASAFLPAATKVSVGQAQTKIVNLQLSMDPLAAPVDWRRCWSGVETEPVPTSTVLIGATVQEGPVHPPLSGLIAYAGSGAPISGVTVECFIDRQEKRIGKTTTNSEGKFSFPQLGEGRYYLQATKKGLHKIRTVVTVTTSSPDTLALFADSK